MDINCSKKPTSKHRALQRKAYSVLFNLLDLRASVPTVTRRAAPLFLLLLFTALLFSTTCTAASSRVVGTEPSPAAGKTSREQCPVTQPPAAPFVPPQPWPQEPPDSQRFWYGEAALWTALPLSGAWAQLADWDKMWLWSEEFDVHKDETPDFVVAAHRLDGEASDFHSEETTNAYHPSWHWAMLTGAHVPQPGCWWFDVTYKGHTLDFVVWVPEP